LKTAIHRVEIILNETKKIKNWFARHAETEANKDIIPSSERFGNIVGFAVILLIGLYFVAHQMESTGFFTSKFDTLTMILFYVSLLFGIVSIVVKVIFGRKNLARPVDVFEFLFATVATSWLFVVFPFEFTYFADVLPDFLRFLVQWISNDVAGVLMAIGIIVAPIVAFYTAIMYMLVRRELSKPTLKTS
jgi:hypothetical protein